MQGLEVARGIDSLADSSHEEVPYQKSEEVLVRVYTAAYVPESLPQYGIGVRLPL